MYDLAVVVPVRRGSSRIANKSMLPFGDEDSLIAWKLGQLIKVIDPARIYLSAEDDEFLAIGDRFGVSRHKRPMRLARDHVAPFREVIADSVDAKIMAFGELYREFGPAVRAAVMAYQRAVPGETRFDKIPRFHRELLGIELTPAEITGWCDRLSDIVLDGAVASPLLPDVPEVPALLQAQGVPAHIVSGRRTTNCRSSSTARGCAASSPRRAGRRRRNPSSSRKSSLPRDCHASALPVRRRRDDRS